VIEPLPSRAVAGTLDELRQARENRWRVAAGDRRLADGQRNLALRHGVAGQRVHDQQDMPAAIAEVLGDAGRVGCSLQTHQRADVGRCGDDDGPAQAFLTENLLDELLDFATPFADQADDDDVSFGIAGHHAEQDALADPGAGEKAHALATADTQQGVDGAYADIERLLDRRSRHRVDRSALQRAKRPGLQRAELVEWAAGAIEDAAEQ
jgi:hypothetical protein